MKLNFIPLVYSLAIAAELTLSTQGSGAQDVNVTGTLSYAAGTGGNFDYSLTLSNAGPEAVESLWLGWTVGVFDIASPTSVGNTAGWSSSVVGNSVQYGGTAGTAIPSGGSAVFTFDSTSTPAEFQSDSAGASVAYGVNASQFAIENTTTDSEEFTLTVVSNTAPPSNSLPFITAEPQSQAVLSNATVTFSITASNAISYQWETNMIELAGETNATLVLSNVVSSDAANYQVIVSNAAGSVTSSVATLIVGYPVNITQQPTNVSVVAGTPVTLQVAATGLPAPQFQWFFNNAALPGQDSAALVLGAATTASEGSYFVTISNAFGSLTSSNAVVTVTPLTTNTKEKLTVTVNPAGSGAVVPNLNGESLFVTHSYNLRAVAGKGQVFSNWSGIVQSEDPDLTFVMPSVSNATLTANFVPSPFAKNEVAGAYSGLFWDTNNLSNETAGDFSATVNDSGIMAGALKIAGASTPFSTALRADGSANLDLKRPGQSPLVLTIQVDLTGLQTLTGTVGDSNKTFSAALTAYRAGFGPSSKATGYEGYYTWAMPGAPGSAPAGYSYGAATVAATGGVQLRLFLSDGTTTAAAGALSINGQMPLYVSLYGGKGSLLSWLSFTNSTNRLTTNGAYWFKGLIHSDAPAPADPYPYSEHFTKAVYDNGFTLTNQMLLLGAYVAEGNGLNALDATDVSVQFSAADLTSSISNVIALNSGGDGGSATNLSVSVSDQTGMFSGSFKDPASGKNVRFGGTILHPVPAGYGFFISGNLSGAVSIERQ